MFFPFTAKHRHSPQKFALLHFPFMKDLHQHLFLANKKKSEDFRFYGKKGEKRK